MICRTAQGRCHRRRSGRVRRRGEERVGDMRRLVVTGENVSFIFLRTRRGDGDDRRDGTVAGGGRAHGKQRFTRGSGDRRRHAFYGRRRSTPAFQHCDRMQRHERSSIQVDVGVVVARRGDGRRRPEATTAYVTVFAVRIESEGRGGSSCASMGHVPHGSPTMGGPFGHQHECAPPSSALGLVIANQLLWKSNSPQLAFPVDRSLHTLNQPKHRAVHYQCDEVVCFERRERERESERRVL